MADSKQIGALLQTWREARGLSRRGAALKAGLGKSTVAYWETGQRLPSVPELNALLDALQATASQRLTALSSLHVPRARQPEAILAITRAAIAPPCSGDLLRAMRLRAQFTQAELAARMDVLQSTVSRWERGEAWPEALQLHTLCYTLGAQEAELIALTTGSFLAGDPEALGMPNWQEVSDRLSATLFMTGNVTESLRELNLLRIEALLWKHRHREKLAGWMLAHAYGWHAQLHRQRGWLRDARRVMQRLETLEQEELGLRIWSQNQVTVRAHLAVYQPGKPDFWRGVQLLMQEMETITDLPTRAWVLSELALYLASSGENETAVVLGKRAWKWAASTGFPREKRLRSRDLADILVRTGRSAEALEWLPGLSEETTEGAILEKQIRAEALLSLGRKDEAAAQSVSLFALMDAHGLNYLRPRAELLKRSLERTSAETERHEADLPA